MRGFDKMNDFANYFKRFNEVTKQLEKKFDDYSILEIYQIIEILQENPTDEEIEKSVSELQEINDGLFEKYGVCDEIIDFQVCINKIRNYKDITDEKEIINKAVDGDFVQ